MNDGSRGAALSRKSLLAGIATMGLAGTLTMRTHAAAGVVGAWKLESFEERTHGVPEPRFGPHPVGYLIYTASGRVSATLGGSHRPALDAASASSQACAKSVYDFLAYAGRYEIRGDEVFHHIETSVFTNLIGVTLRRGFHLNGDTLTIRTLPPYIWGAQSVLVWRRS